MSRPASGRPPDGGLDPVVIVGGKGQLGALFVRWFTEAGHVVRMLERDDWPRADALLADARLVPVSVPILPTEPVVADLAGRLPDRCILADVTSIKRRPLAAMLAAHAGPVVGLHPMFGPDVESASGQVIVTCEGRDAAGCAPLLARFVAWGARLSATSAEAHDAAMVHVSAMRHLTTIVYGRHLRAEGADIILQGPGGLAMARRFIARLTAAVDDLERGDREGVLAGFREVTAWLGPLAPRFREESTALLRAADDARG